MKPRHFILYFSFSFFSDLTYTKGIIYNRELWDVRRILAILSIDLSSSRFPTVKKSRFGNKLPEEYNTVTVSFEQELKKKKKWRFCCCCFFWWLSFLVSCVSERWCWRDGESRNIASWSLPRDDKIWRISCCFSLKWHWQPTTITHDTSQSNKPHKRYNIIYSR